MTEERFYFVSPRPTARLASSSNNLSSIARPTHNRIDNSRMEMARKNFLRNPTTVLNPKNATLGLGTERSKNRTAALSQLYFAS